jgi:hypothetical protein
MSDFTSSDSKYEISDADAIVSEGSTSDSETG